MLGPFVAICIRVQEAVRIEEFDLLFICEREKEIKDMTKVHPTPAPEESARTLRRLPSVYSRSLELPLPTNAIVQVYNDLDADHYVVPRDWDLRPGPVKVRTARLERYGITRVVVHTGPGELDLENDLVYDKWRGSLASTAIPSMTMAGFVDGQLVVIVPKGDLVNGDRVQGRPALSFRKYIGGEGGRRPWRGLCGGASIACAK